MKKVFILSFLATGFVLNAQSFEIFSQYGLYGIRQGKAIVIESTYDTIIKTYSKTRNLFIAKNREYRVNIFNKEVGVFEIN